MSRRRSRKRGQTGFADGTSEDGTDPKRDHDRRTWDHPCRPGRKARQLCGQVADALRVTLDGLADEVLQNLTVLSVEPAPNSGRLLVTVAGPTTADVTDRDTTRDKLAKASGHIRSSIASAVHRRKAPEIVFALI